MSGRIELSRVRCSRLRGVGTQSRRRRASFAVVALALATTACSIHPTVYECTFIIIIYLPALTHYVGVLFICFNVDHRLLWGGVTASDVADSLQFYTTFYNAPLAIKVRPL